MISYFLFFNYRYVNHKTRKIKNIFVYSRTFLATIIIWHDMGETLNKTKEQKKG